MTTCDVAPYDVFLMWVEFPDHPGIGKTRPVVITEVDDDSISGVVAKVTSRTDWTGAGDVLLLDWQEAGLLAPSMVRCGERFEFKREDLYRRFGALSDRDAERVASGLERTQDVLPHKRVRPRD